MRDAAQISIYIFVSDELHSVQLEIPGLPADLKYLKAEVVLPSGSRDSARIQVKANGELQMKKSK